MKEKQKNRGVGAARGHFLSSSNLVSAICYRVPSRFFPRPDYRAKANYSYPCTSPTNPLVVADCSFPLALVLQQRGQDDWSQRSSATGTTNDCILHPMNRQPSLGLLISASDRRPTGTLLPRVLRRIATCCIQAVVGARDRAWQTKHDAREELEYAGSRASLLALTTRLEFETATGRLHHEPNFSICLRVAAYAWSRI
ncbi:hypothetical protein BU23DRAFT_214500 [Bimuria novae-zelandiae CBS 107.79]|uniref:Uncharacterized protein n=1 Tax=Bimuria novae-zelandiae CBS 107.79 TaxID=1447943 RepID=A0A6A5VAL4_9PLEO|nr:hypothetical protein BU23DRAFT_214500 [Bimuria novae-zelandiae CBS 107.79]